MSKKVAKKNSPFAFQAQVRGVSQVRHQRKIFSPKKFLKSEGIITY
jgi:hypothetical protein